MLLRSGVVLSFHPVVGEVVLFSCYKLCLSDAVWRDRFPPGTGRQGRGGVVNRDMETLVVVVPVLRWKKRDEQRNGRRNLGTNNKAPTTRIHEVHTPQISHQTCIKEQSLPSEKEKDTNTSSCHHSSLEEEGFLSNHLILKSTKQPGISEHRQ